MPRGPKTAPGRGRTLSPPPPFPPPGPGEGKGEGKPRCSNTPEDPGGVGGSFAPSWVKVKHVNTLNVFGGVKTGGIAPRPCLLAPEALETELVSQVTAHRDVIARGGKLWELSALAAPSLAGS